MLDLNNPADARTYVMSWVEEDDRSVRLIDDGSDEDIMRVAKQLFLYVDPRSQAGEIH